MPPDDQPKTTALDRLVATLTLERIDDNLYRGLRGPEGWQRVYGGQVLAQALLSAAQTVPEDRPIHSLHGYFLLAGDPKHDIIYDVERIRDGGSFTTRRVKAIQHGRAIFAMSASFQKAEGGFDHQSTMPNVPAPETLPNIKDLMQQYLPVLPENMRAYWQREQPLDVRLVDPSRYASRDKRAPEQAIWFKTMSKLPDVPSLQQAVLAYASDFSLLDTALIAHGKVMFDKDIQLASLDHAMWFHRPFRADSWLLYAQDSPSASGARGFCRGAIFDLDGRLVASTVQEGLMRKRDTAFVIS